MLLADSCESDIHIEILLGADVFQQVIQVHSFEKINETIAYLPTVFGYALQGSQESYKSNVRKSVLTSFCMASLDVQVLWDLETLGIKEKEEQWIVMILTLTFIFIFCL